MISFALCFLFFLLLILLPALSSACLVFCLLCLLLALSSASFFVLCFEKEKTKNTVSSLQKRKKNVYRYNTEKINTFYSFKSSASVCLCVCACVCFCFSLTFIYPRRCFNFFRMMSHSQRRSGRKKIRCEEKNSTWREGPEREKK